MAAKAIRRNQKQPTNKRKPWTKEEKSRLRQASREYASMASLQKQFKRTSGAIRQMGFQLGISLGERTRNPKPKQQQRRRRRQS